MELTFIGYAQIVLGCMIVVAGSLRHALAFLMASTLFGGSAAAVLPALGGSSIPPVQFALCFVILRALVPGSAGTAHLTDAFRANRWLALYVVYGAITALVLPRIFAGTVNVFPMNYVYPRDTFASVPLQPSNQNLTATLNLTGALLTALVVWIACRSRGAANTLATSLVALAWVHALLGLAGVALRGTSADAALELFRNSSYLQFDDEIGGFARIRGVYAEASGYASAGVILFVANAELWYHSIRGRASGLAALFMGAVLFFSTSSTAYLGLSAYGAFFAIRAIALPGIAPFAKTRTAMAAVGTLVVISVIAFITMPSLVDSVVDVVLRMTVEKSTSESGQQRLYWTIQSWDMFVASDGLGVGAGSFRSSSMFFAILGSMGVVGVFSFLLYLLSAFQPWRRSTWTQTAVPMDNLGGALGTAALVGLVPAMVSSATAIPGPVFIILAAASLSLRPFDLARRNQKFENDRPTDMGVPSYGNSREEQIATGQS